MSIEFDEGAQFHRHVCDGCGEVIDLECDSEECKESDEELCEDCEQDLTDEAWETTEPDEEEDINIPSPE